MTRRHEACIDSIRSLCNVLVVAVHAWPIRYAPCHDVVFWTMTGILQHCFIILLPTLFLLSGYLMFRGVDGNLTMAEYRRKIFSRFRHLIVPSEIWNLIFAAVYSLAQCVGMEIPKRMSSFDLCSTKGFLRQLLLIDLYDSPLWYVRTIFLCALFSQVFGFVYKITNWRVLATVVLGGAILADCTGAVWILNSPYYSFGCYILGGAIAVNKKEILSVFTNNRRQIAVIGILALIGQISRAIYRDIPGLQSQLVMLLVAPLCWAFANEIHKLWDCTLTRKFMRTSSFFIYMSHFLFCSLFAWTLGHIIPTFEGKFILMSLFMIALVLMSTIALRLMLQRFCPKVLDILEGKL